MVAKYKRRTTVYFTHETFERLQKYIRDKYLATPQLTSMLVDEAVLEYIAAHEQELK